MSFDFNQTPTNYIKKKEAGVISKPLVSIITPFYNDPYFFQTFNCVINQTFEQFEWIIIDAGSTKHLKELNQLSISDNRIKLISCKASQPAIARNIGIDASNTDIIIFLDSDDLIIPEYIEYLYFALITNPDASWAYTDAVGFGEEKYIWQRNYDPRMMKYTNILTNSAAVRKKCLYDVGLFEPKQNLMYEDWVLWLKLINKGKYPVHINIKGFWYRRKSDGAMSKVSSNKKNTKQALKYIKNIGAGIKQFNKAIEFPVNSAKPFASISNRKWNIDKHKDSNKKHVLILIPHMEMGGADIFNIDLIEILVKHQYKVTVLTTIHSPNRWKQRFELCAHEIYELPAFLKMTDWNSFIHHIIDSRGTDLIFLSNSYYGYYALPDIKKEHPEIPVVDYVHMEEMYWRNGGYARTSASLSDIIDKTYVCNESLRQFLINTYKLDSNKIETQYIGVDNLEFSHNNSVKNFKKDYGIPEKNKIVLFPCRIHEQKRPFLMLEICKSFCKNRKDIKFVVVGDGPLLKQVVKKAKKMKLADSLIFVGSQKDMRKFYADSNVTLICSLKEGLALTTYESMSMGVPVVSSDVGGHGELIDDSVGKLIPLLQSEEHDLGNLNYGKEHVEPYVEAILDIIDNPEKHNQLSINCINRISKYFKRNDLMEIFHSKLAVIINEGTQDKNNMVSLKELSKLAQDYLALYIEYERNQSNFNEVYKILSSIRDVLTLKKNILSFISELKEKRHRLFKIRRKLLLHAIRFYKRCYFG